MKDKIKQLHYQNNLFFLLYYFGIDQKSLLADFFVTIFLKYKPVTKL